MNLSRNTVSGWLKKEEMCESEYPERRITRLTDPYTGQLRQWLETDSHRPGRDRRTVRVMSGTIKGKA